MAVPQTVAALASEDQPCPENGGQSRPRTDTYCNDHVHLVLTANLLVSRLTSVCGNG
ncbi:hypothetical protein Salmuc_05239 [Salipiger mucosus DSM 16094]|uniref:Uncharacterized protein n=1 Tax=Salipiger mucosus DSM 16094 TaxID=1123237 RepID=S9RWU1_9RHOB|nr:hypothetical protein Salmuc_05239 [Salipiger mucosus DSM 16094]